jgi:hypothetical protein
MVRQEEDVMTSISGIASTAGPPVAASTRQIPTEAMPFEKFLPSSPPAAPGAGGGGSSSVNSPLKFPIVNAPSIIDPLPYVVIEVAPSNIPPGIQFQTTGADCAGAKPPISGGSAAGPQAFAATPAGTDSRAGGATACVEQQPSDGAGTLAEPPVPGGAPPSSITSPASGGNLPQTGHPNSFAAVAQAFATAELEVSNMSHLPGLLSFRW